MNRRTFFVSRITGLVAAAIRLRWVGYLTLFVALAALRVEHLFDQNMSLAEAWKHSLATGLANDLLLVAVVEAAGGVVALALPKAARWAWTVAAAALVLAGLSNVLYFKYFGSQLPFWVIRSHLHEVPYIVGSASGLGASLLIVLSLAALLIGIAFAFISRAPRPRWAPFVVSMVMISVAYGAKDIVRRPTVIPQASGVLGSFVLIDWIKNHNIKGGDVKLAQLRSGKDSLELLAEYRKRERATEYPAARDAQWPLYAPLPVDLEETARWRALLGLPESGPINVYFVYMESVRAYEFLHPIIGPSVFPHLNELVDKHGIVYAQTYTSSVGAGQTVRGRFSSQCSMLPNIGAPAPSIHNPAMRITCLQELFRNQGYETVWIDPYNRTFHNQGPFELAHGTNRIVDEPMFRARGVTEELGDWGLADAPYLKEAAKVLKEVVAEGAPVFMSTINISTHHPHSVIAEGPLDDAMLELTKNALGERAYLSRLRYSQEAIAGFIRETLDAPGGDTALFVVAGDHGIAHHPGGDLRPEQVHELLFRVPLVLMTKNLTEPKRFDHPIHQMDIAPMVARIVGLSGDTAWIGRETALEGPGSPFVFIKENGVHYRTADRLCYTLEKATPTCWHVPPGVDPLFDELEEVPADPAEVDFFHDVAVAARQAVAFGQLRPPASAYVAQ